MAVNATDRDAFMRALLDAFGEDYMGASKVIRYLQIRFSTVAWMTSLRAVAATWQPFIDSGLSITWWCDEVQRLAAP